MKVEIQRASEHAFQDAFLVGAFIVLLTIIPAFFLPGRPPKKEKMAIKDKLEDVLIME
jgi:hypothetical protein